MKKIAIFALVAGAVLLAAGCKNTNQNQNQGTTQNREKEKSGIANSIKDAMGLGQKMKCTYRYTFGGQTEESVAYVEGKKYKSSYDMNGQKSNNFFDGETSYTWNEGAKTGTKISLACLEEIGEKYKNEEQNQNQNQFKAGEDAFENAVDTKCEPTTENISLPDGVTFTDQCDEMKTQMQALDEMTKKFKNMGQ